jgi:hypothetical protein
VDTESGKVRGIEIADGVLSWQSGAWWRYDGVA